MKTILTIALLLETASLVAADSNDGRLEIKLPAGSLVSENTQSSGMNHRVRLLWIPSGAAQPVVLLAGEGPQSGLPSMTVGAGFAEADWIGVVVGYSYGSCEFLKFHRDGAAWSLVAKGALGSMPFDSEGITFQSVDSFTLARHNKKPDAFLVTDKPDPLGALYKMVLRNGIELGDDTKGRPSRASVPAKNAIKAELEPDLPSIKPAGSPEKPNGKSAIPIEPKDQGWLLWLIITVGAVGSVLLILRQTSKRNTSP